MRTRALRAAVIAAALTTAVVGFLLLRPGDAEHQPQTTIEQALAGFVGDRFNGGYVGTCPLEFLADGDVPRGMCSARNVPDQPRKGADGTPSKEEGR